MHDLNQEYEFLVAAFALRDPDFAAEFGPILLRISRGFFGYHVTSDVVSHGLRLFIETGEFLPAAALKTDMALLGNSAVARDTFDMVIDAIFKVPLKGRSHVEETLITQARARLLMHLGSPEEYVLSGRVGEYLSALREIDGLGASKTDQVMAIADDFDVMMDNTPEGVPIGFPKIDAALNGGGLCPGEMALVLGRYNVGKSQMLNNIAVSSAKAGRPVFFVSFETSMRNTRMRLAKVALNWNDEQINARPRQFADLVRKELGDLPLYVHYTSGIDYTFPALEKDIKRAEERLGEKIEVVIRDYGELMADDPDDYRSVRRSYKGFKDFVGERGIIGVDAAQKNRQGKISHFNLLKDADIVIDLEKAEGNDTILIATIARNREGQAGIKDMLKVDRTTGRMHEHEFTIDDVEEIEAERPAHASEEQTHERGK